MHVTELKKTAPSTPFYQYMSMQVIGVEEYLSKSKDVLFVTKILEMLYKMSIGVTGHYKSRLRCKLKVNHLHYIRLFNN